MGGGARWATPHGAAKSQTRLSDKDAHTSSLGASDSSSVGWGRPEMVLFPELCLCLCPLVPLRWQPYHLPLHHQGYSRSCSAAGGGDCSLGLCPPPPPSLDHLGKTTGCIWREKRTQVCHPLPVLTWKALLSPGLRSICDTPFCL